MSDRESVRASEPTDIEQVAEFVANTRSLSLQPSLVETAKLLVLDSLGCAVLAAKLAPTEALIATLDATESLGPASVWLHDEGFSPANAAMVNATAVHGFELDDITTSLGHYGSVTVPVALALAEAGAPLSGLDLIRSVVVGTEVGLRMNACTGSAPHLVAGFHGPSLFGTFAAAATASAVLGLSSANCVDAFGHAAQFAAGIMGTQHGGMGKRLLPGRAAQSGVFAAELAAHGFTSTARIFDCGYGSFPSAFTGGGDDYDLSRLSAGLGSEFCAEAINFKMWACRIPIHPSLEAIKALRAEHPFAAADVVRVDIGLPEGSFKSVGAPYVPDTAASAQLNLQYCVAVMLAENEVFREQSTEDKIRDGAILELASRVNVRHRQELDAAVGGLIADESDVEVLLKDGTLLRQRGVLRGSAGAPIAADAVIAKFGRCCAGNLSEALQEALVEYCLDLENLGDATALCSLLHPM